MKTLAEIGGSEALITLEHIYKRFNPRSVNETVLFDEFIFMIFRGQFVSVFGSNGSGKTTLLNLICGSIPEDSGNILIEGRNINGQAEYRRAARIGRVFQDPAKGTCAALSILENLSLADRKGSAFNLMPGVNRRRIDDYRAMLERLGLGLEDKLEIPVGSLSGGQRQALAMLIATMTPIDLLVLDEHTAALDPKSSDTVMDLTDQVVREKGLTAIMVTHNLRYAVDYGNRLVMMHEGKAIIDAADGEKAAYSIDDLLKVFTSISIECGN